MNADVISVLIIKKWSLICSTFLGIINLLHSTSLFVFISSRYHIAFQLFCHLILVLWSNVNVNVNIYFIIYVIPFYVIYVTPHAYVCYLHIQIKNSEPLDNYHDRDLDAALSNHRSTDQLVGEVNLQPVGLAVLDHLIHLDVDMPLIGDHYRG